MSESSRLLNLEFHQGLMGIKYNELISRLKRVERLMNTTEKDEEDEEMMRNKEISETTEE